MINRRRCCLVLTGALALAGCGSSSSSPLTQAQLVSQVNRACTSYSAAVRGLLPPSDITTNTDAAAAYLDKLKGPVHAESDKITALTPNGAVKEEFGRFVRATKYQLGLFTDADAKAHAHNGGFVVDLDHAARYKRRVLDRLERQLGFTSCLS
ncbi:MAG: hypothetical protein ACR2OB_14520 [Solirubrobacteraceae bacterium]